MMKPNRKRTILWVTVIIVVLLAVAAIAFYMLGGPDRVKSALQPEPQGLEIVTVEGKVLCLPPKDDSAPSTLDCALGIHTTEGTYYGLGDSDTSVTSKTGTDTIMQVTGELDPQTSDKYQMEGVIAVSDAKVVE